MGSTFKHFLRAVFGGIGLASLLYLIWKEGYQAGYVIGFRRGVISASTIAAMDAKVVMITKDIFPKGIGYN